MKESGIRLISILITFMIFLAALVLMKEAGISKPIRILVAIVLVVVIDFIKSKIFKR